jgi:hypothetical protein
MIQVGSRCGVWPVQISTSDSQFVGNSLCRVHAFAFCIPTRGNNVTDWRHEIKLDGYRLRLKRNCDRVRLITRAGYNRAGRLQSVDRRGGAEEPVAEKKAAARCLEVAVVES